MRINRLFDKVVNHENGVYNQIKFFTEKEEYLGHSIFFNKAITSKYDLVHIHSIRSKRFRSWCRNCLSNNVPYILSAHGTLCAYKYILPKRFHWRYILQDILIRPYIKKAKFVLVNSIQESNEALGYGLDKNHIKIVKIPIDVKKYYVKRKRIIKKGEKVRFLFVGNLSDNRNVGKSIFMLMNTFGCEFEFRIVGNIHKSSRYNKASYIDDLMGMINDNHLVGQVKVILGLSKDEIIEEYKKADIFINSSNYESFGQCIMEACASGLPIISTQVGFAREIKTIHFHDVYSDNTKVIRHNLNKLKEHNKSSLGCVIIGHDEK